MVGYFFPENNTQTKAQLNWVLKDYGTSKLNHHVHCKDSQLPEMCGNWTVNFATKYPLEYHNLAMRW